MEDKSVFFFFGKGLFYFPRTTWQIARSILFAHVYEVTFLGEKTARYGAKAYHHHWNHMPLPKQQSYKRNHVPNPSKTVSKIHDILTLGCTSINDKTHSLKIGTLAENNRKKLELHNDYRKHKQAITPFDFSSGETNTDIYDDNINCDIVCTLIVDRSNSCIFSRPPWWILVENRRRAFSPGL